MNIAFIIPCFNESLSIEETIKACLTAIPTSTVYVINNNSSDNTAGIAKDAGAIVINENSRGKGFAVKRAFMSINADIYIMLDGDGTYDSSVAPLMVEILVNNRLDMVVGTRVENTNIINNDTYRKGHRLGNKLFNYVLKTLFKSPFTDIFSGYRVMSKAFVKSLPIRSKGFDIETEISLHAIQLGLPTQEINTNYGKRQEGSTSKLSTYKDGIKILFRIIILFSEIFPFKFYGLLSLILFIACLLTGGLVTIAFFKTGIVEHFPTAILSSGLGIIGFLTLFTGIIVHYIALVRIEKKILFYNVFKENCNVIKGKT